jgi:hypothetical protein
MSGKCNIWILDASSTTSLFLLSTNGANVRVTLLLKNSHCAVYLTVPVLSQRLSCLILHPEDSEATGLKDSTSRGHRVMQTLQSLPDDS